MVTAEATARRTTTAIRKSNHHEEQNHQDVPRDANVEKSDPSNKKLKHVHEDVTAPAPIIMDQTPRIEKSSRKLRYLEFYAGVGGWRMALEQALIEFGNTLDCQEPSTGTNGSEQGSTNDMSPEQDEKQNTAETISILDCECVGALDHSDLCVSVYQHNFGNPNQHPQPSATNKKKSRRLGTTDITNLTAHQLQTQYRAHVWFMSPPCQPHTRQHSNQEQETNDPRSQSFLHLCDLLEQLNDNKQENKATSASVPQQQDEEYLPQLICLENVVHFESSQSCQRFRNVLTACNYSLAEFHLTPTQVQLPNDRPRYFCVAIRRQGGSSMALATNKNGEQPCHARTLWKTYFSHFDSKSSSDHEKVSTSPQTQQSSSTSTAMIHQSIPELGVLPLPQVEETSLPPLQSFLQTASSSASSSTSTETTASLRVPDKVLDRNAAWCFDIVTPQQSRSSCFTSGYGRLVRGTGSVLYQATTQEDEHDWTLVAPQDREFDANWRVNLDPSQLRYFSGMEMAQLFGFSKSFNFPTNCSLKQQWKLIGNSLNSRLASRLILLGLLAIFGHQDHDYKGDLDIALG